MGDPAHETLWDVLGAGPDEPYTLAGDHDVAAVAAYTLGEGRYALREVGGPRTVPASPDAPPDAWCTETFGCSAMALFERASAPGRITALRACIAGITLGGASERQRFERTLGTLRDPSARAAYAASWRRPGCADMDRRVRAALVTVSPFPTFGLGELDPLPGRPAPPRRPVWELVFAQGKHPGAEYTLAGPHDVASVAVYLLGLGAYGLREVVREGEPRVTPVCARGPDEAWCQSTFGCTASQLTDRVLDTRVGELIDCLAGLILGTGAERELYLVGLSVLSDPMQRAKYEAGWRDGRPRTVDLCDEATDLAAGLEDLRRLGAGTPDPARPR